MLELMMKSFPEGDKLREFYNQCMTAESSEDFFALIDLYVKYSYQEFVPGIKHIYNDIIGWALPSKIVCTRVVDFMHSLPPDANLVDLGAGSGIMSYMFHLCGLSKERIIAVDLTNPTHVGAFDMFEKKKEESVKRSFWPIVRDDHYKVNPKDVLFIAWGTHQMYKIFEQYIKDGGRYIILLGEHASGCTSPPSDYFEDDKEWKVELIHVPGAASEYMEHLSINVRL